MNELEVIVTFVEHLNRLRGLNLNITSRPDTTNRETPDIDAIAGNFAIEHTSIDTLPNQRRDSYWFNNVVRGLGDEFRDRLSYKLTIILENDAVKPGQDWKSIRTALRKWVLENADDLSFAHHRVAGITGIPFPLSVSKNMDLGAGLFFARFDPNDTTLAERTKALLDKKVSKLLPYKEKNYETFLLVETRDCSLMNSGKLLRAIQAAFGSALPSALSELWYIDTSIREHIWIEDFTNRV